MPPRTFNFKDPQGRTLRVNSPDGSIPTEREIDRMFAIKYKDVGEIKRTPSGLEELGTRLKRFGAGETKALLGDIPFIRKALPRQIQEYKRQYKNIYFFIKRKEKRIFRIYIRFKFKIN